MMSSSDISKRIKNLVKEQGIDACGIARAEYLEDCEHSLRAFLDKGSQGEMTYLERNVDKRLDPRQLVEGAKSVISVMLNYYPSFLQLKNVPQIAKYAYGEDYHKVLKDKLFTVCDRLQKEIGSFSYRVFVDSAPVLEREWARRASLGWIGKNTHLIHPKMGSYFFLGEIITDLELEYDPLAVEADRCGACRRCQMACPTGAINGDRTMDAKRCLSYLTIEDKSEVPQEYHPKLQNRLYGCDICLDVCPWNRFKRPSTEFSVDSSILNADKEYWLRMSKDEFDIKFSQSALKRAGIEKIQSTARFCD